MAEEPQKVLTKTEARQGVTPHMTRYVLTYGLGGVIVLFIVVYLVFFAH
jgi:hypothetical protein